MAIVKVEHIYATMDKEQTPYWRVTDNSGVRNRIDENDTEENVESAKELLQLCIDNIEDNVICIMLSNKTRTQKSGGGRGFKQFEFKVNLNKGTQGAAGGFNTNNVLGLLITQMGENAKLMREITEEKNHNELRKLQDQVKELKDGGGNKAWEMIAQAIAGMTKKHNSVGIAGDEDDTIDEKIVEAQTKTRKALKRLSKVDKYLPDTLTKLANFAVKYPTHYKMMMPMLDNPDELAKSFTEDKK